jgi:3-methyladenine DNA glycosylase AlkD
MQGSEWKMSDVAQRIRNNLKENVDEKTRNSFQRFFKDEVKFYGVKTGTVGKIAEKYWNEIKGRNKKEIFELCEELLGSDYNEEASIVSFWGMNFKDFVEPGDLAVFERWIRKYVNNWAKCDGFCNHTVGDLIVKYPGRVEELKKWAESDNRWLKRASAVTLIIPAKKGEFLKEAFEISTALLVHADDMVQKGYGWLLKEESRKHQKEVFEYVMKNRHKMPRTALRYAIELMPMELRKKAMEK